MKTFAGCGQEIEMGDIMEGVRSPVRRLPVLTGNVLREGRALVLYRYISWFLTSLFYLTGPPDSPFYFKLGVVLALLVAGGLSVQLYRHSKGTDLNALGIVSIETVGIAALLVPTGGLDSPFMWYALNPIFMAAVLLPGYCWVALGIFLLAASVGSAFFNSYPTPIQVVWRDKSWLLLVFLLLTTSAQLFTKLIKQLSGAYKKLSCAHQSTERLLEHISALSQALEALSSGKDSRHLAGLLAEYARRLTGSRAGVCCLVRDQHVFQLEVSDPGGVLSGLVWQGKMDSLWSHLKEGREKVYRLFLESDNSKGEQFIYAPVQSPSTCYGLVGYLAPSSHFTEDDVERAIIFLTDLGAIALERRKADELAARLLVAEEQNRIANEIHDGVSQHLFSIVYALHALSQKQMVLHEDEIRQQLNLIKETANQVARELRASIYRISPRRRGERVFVAGVTAYLEGLAQLNGIKVDLKVEGSEEAVSPALRKALYRIINEATSNAIRHGNCEKIEVSLEMAPGKVVLKIVDDGRGFIPGCQSKCGLGLVNMRSLMTSFNGRFTVESKPGRGARITCAVPADVKTSDTGGIMDESCCS